jgi:hypothetical protein
MNDRQPIDNKQLTTNINQPQTIETDNEQPTTDNERPTTDNEQPTTDNEQPTPIMNDYLLET